MTSESVVALFAETGGFQFGDGDEVLLRERLDLDPAQFGNVAETAEVAAHVAGQRAHIGALAAFDLENGAVGSVLDQIEAADLDLARRNVDRLAVAGKVIGALA